mmetsp:Transcript_25436/g.37577  ORF Transcript_25436/g.37577 Transcript_25436/m.37577 type:complete len:173 (+) Transcript_25436:238-756(+)
MVDFDRLRIIGVDSFPVLVKDLKKRSGAGLGVERTLRIDTGDSRWLFICSGKLRILTLELSLEETDASFEEAADVTDFDLFRLLRIFEEPKFRGIGALRTCPAAELGVEKTLRIDTGDCKSFCTFERWLSSPFTRPYHFCMGELRVFASELSLEKTDTSFEEATDVIDFDLF